MWTMPISYDDGTLYTWLNAKTETETLIPKFEIGYDMLMGYAN